MTPSMPVADDTVNDAPTGDTSDWIAKLGIVDRATGHATATAARERLIAAGRKVLGLTARSWTTELFVFSGLLARAQGLHEGSVAAIGADNPFAAFPLLRSYAENAAAVLYVTDNPGQLDRFWRDRDGPGVKVGRLTNHADTRFAGFRHIYAELSRYAHPMALSLLASMRLEEPDQFVWSSSPSFRSESDALTAYAWTVELSEANSHLLVEYGDAFGLTPRS
jgi:hypothetical protein